MKISENDIASTELFGMLDGKPVNLLRTRGGLNLAVKTDSKGEDEVIGAASHQAILCYNVEQRFPSFQPAVMKNERPNYETDRHSHFLSNDLRKSGYDIYSVQDGVAIDFFVTKQDVNSVLIAGSAHGVIIGDLLLVKSLDASKEFVKCLSGAVSEKALSEGLKGVRIK
jgi:hypothetical protein